MRCCVPSCKNDSRHLSKSQGITFHVFPNEPSLRTAWLRALGKESWEPKERSAICSEHFLNDDLYETRSGLRKVRVGAVPIIIQDCNSCDYGEPASLKVCRICLAMDVKLYSIRKYKLEQAYENLTGLSLSTDNLLPQKLCAECAHRLVSCCKFRNKCLRANTLMTEIIKKQNNLTVHNLKSINRENNQLTSNIKIKYNSPDDYLYINDENDTYIENKEPDVCMDNLDDVEIKNEINNDSEIFIDEYNHKDESDINVVEDVANDNYLPSDRDYSTDDSIPLSLRKSKRPKLKKSVKKLKKEPTLPKIDRRRKPFLNEDLNETLFTITDLTVDEQLAEIQKRQDSANYKNAVYKCTECFKGFLDEAAYNSHMTRHTNQCGEYSCEICKTHFKFSYALRKHITAHHTQRYSCRQCPYVTTHRQTARLHERWHKGTKYQCPHCKDEFVKFTTYMGHVRIKHPSDFVCELCGYSFVSAKGIELHKKLKHRLDNCQIPDDGPFCEQCNVRFKSVAAHKRHLNVSARHNSDAEKEPNKPKKGRKSREERELERREREKGIDSDEKRKVYPSQIRKAEGPIPCEQCGLQLEDSRAYHGHFRRMHPDKNRTNYPSMKSPCMCEVCGRMFQSFALLKDHTWVHTGERPFKCESCGKSFRMKQRLVAHRRVHSDARASYVCAVCGKHFSTHSNRQRHMFIHTGLKPFKCEMCGKGFKHSSEKRAHVTYVHLKKPWPKRARGPRRGKQPPAVQDPPAMWPPCEPKLADLSAVLHDKPLYYDGKM